MIIIETSKKKFELTDEEFNIIKKLLNFSLDFHISSYNMFEDIAKYNDMKNIEEAMDELIESQEEKEILFEINKNVNLVKIIKEIISM